MSPRLLESKPIPKPGILPFAIAITILNILGHLWLGFEPAWIVPFISIFTAYLAEISVELLIKGFKEARFRGGILHLITFLLPAHITGLAVGMLLYTNEQFLIVAFATSVAMFSKVLLRAPVPNARNGATIHFMNPSNFGIAVTLIVFSDLVGVAQPYQFTENVSGLLDWILPILITVTGSFLNIRATKRIVLVISWLIGFAAQAAVRAVISDQEIQMLLAPMSGMAFILFTFYMVSDPVTTPSGKSEQIIFGFSTALIYGLLTHAGIVFGLFFSLCLSCAFRGALMYASKFWEPSAPIVRPTNRSKTYFIPPSKDLF